MNKFKKLAQDGFSHLELILILVVAAALVGTGVLVYRSNTSHAGGLNYHYLTTVTRKDNSIVALFGCYEPPVNAVASSVVSTAASTSVSSNTKVYQHIHVQAFVYPGASSTSKNFSLKLTDYSLTASTNVFSKTTNGLMANLTLTDVNNVAAKNAFANVTLASANGSTTNFRFPYKVSSFYCSTVDKASSAAASVPTSATSYVTSSTVSAPVSVFVTQQ